MEAQHTPLPWSCDEWDHKIVALDMPRPKFGKDLEYDSPFIVAQPWIYSSPDKGTTRANCRLIVRAVNSHAALVDAVKQAQRMGEAWMRDACQDCVEYHDSPDYAAALMFVNEMKAALATLNHTDTDAN